MTLESFGFQGILGLGDANERIWIQSVERGGGPLDGFGETGAFGTRGVGETAEGGGEEREEGGKE